MQALLVAIVALLIGAGAAIVTDEGPLAELGIILDRTTTTTTTTTTSTIPPTFPPIVDDAEVNAVRTPNGFVLPVLGGGPGAWLVRSPCLNEVVTTGTEVVGAHIVLDPGHGGAEEPGAVGPVLGIVERDLNLDIALRVQRLLEAEGATVVLTRDRNVRMTLQTRGEIARSLDPLLFVSIHHNGGAVGTAATPVPEVYHQLADPASKRFAGLLNEEFIAHFTAFGSEWAVGDDPGARARRSLATGDDFYGVLRHSQGVPAVISEPVYLSSPVEEALLATEAFKDAEARAIVDAVMRFVETDDPGSGFRPVKEAPAPSRGGGGPEGCVDPEL